MMVNNTGKPLLDKWRRIAKRIDWFESENLSCLARCRILAGER
jgi:hypothetical protein